MTMTERRVFRDRVLIEVDWDVGKWRTEHGDEDLPEDEVRDDLTTMWAMTDVAEIVQHSRLSFERCATVREIVVGPRDRSDEAGFRQIVPRYVDGAEVLAVHNFKAGGDGRYAAAVALCWWTGRHVQPWSTHLIYHRDDVEPDGEWLLDAGEYAHYEEYARKSLISRKP